ncbi:MAG TPA: hypothetical protein VMB84_00985 [Stellaceae bacterium]|nr:hypothetical protein [Stellaceae bacterium]
MNRLPKLAIRPLDLVLIAVSSVIVLVAGLSSVFDGNDVHSRIRQDCELFYRSAGAPAVDNCIATMRAGRGGPVAR